MELDKALKWLPVNMLFVLMLFTGDSCVPIFGAINVCCVVGFVSLKHNALTMVTLFKNLTNIITVTGDWLIYKVGAL